MKLTDIQFCRVSPFFAALNILNEKLGVPAENDKAGKTARPEGRQWDNVLKSVADYTTERANKYAVELGVDFPDENEPEALPFSPFSVAIENRIASDEIVALDIEPSPAELAEIETEISAI